MIHLESKYNCCGCEACVQICPRRCISFREDGEGFMYPEVDESSCIECGLCEKVCPVLNQSETISPGQVYAAKNKAEEILLRSSSGGVFAAIADKILSSGGSVFGASFSDDFTSVGHTHIETESELSALIGSKYLQSRIGNSFSEAKELLDKDRDVLFCGTSCQIRALKLFLRKDYPKLLTVDIICHGVPSPGVWRKYLSETVPAGRKIKHISFRDKVTGWSHFSISITDDQNKKILSEVNDKNPYMWIFLNNFDLRPSCYKCPARGGKSQSDVTIADFWGIKQSHPEFHDEKGVSLLIVNSDKGQKFIEGLPLTLLPCSSEEALKENPAYHSSAAEPDSRDKFFKLFSGGTPVKTIYRKLHREKTLSAIPIYIIRKTKALIRKTKAIFKKFL